VISQRLGRFLSAAGAVLLAAGLFATWYHVTRQGGLVESSSGFDTFPRLRAVILLGAIALLLTSVVRQSRPVLVARMVIGLVLGLLIMRRILFPPDIADPVSTQFGVLIGLVGALAAAIGGLVDAGREVVERYPQMPFGRPAGALGAGASEEPVAAARRPRRPAGGGAVVDSTAEAI
jgi:hypothetical protein